MAGVGKHAREVNQDSPDDRGTQKLRAKFKKETAEAILDATEAALASDGLQTARMETIASRAGIAVGTVYNHFADRKQLVEALITHRHADLLAQLDHLLAESQGWPFDRVLVAMVEVLLDAFDKHRGFYALLVQGDLSREVGATACLSRRSTRELRERVEQVVDRGVASSVLCPERAVLCPSAILGMIHGVVLRTIFDGDGAPVRGRAPALCELFLYGASPRGAARPPTP